jgi:hypothetical protein
MHTLLTLYIKRAKFTNKNVMPQTLCHLHVPNKNILHTGVTETRGYAKERCKTGGEIKRKW